MARRLLIGMATLVAMSVAGAPLATAATEPTAAAVELIDVKFDKRHGTATLLVHVSGPGTLTLAGGQVVARSVECSGTGIAKLKVASKGGALKELIRSRAVEVRVRLEFVATEGARASVTRKLTLRRPRSL